MVKLAAALCAYGRELSQQSVHKSYYSLLTVFSHTKRNLAMPPAPARSVLATSLGKLCARIFL